MEWVITALVIALIAVAVVWGVAQARSAALRRRFGDEYERAVERHGDRRRAEADLRELARRHDELDVRPLPPEARNRYAGLWRAAQARFVDDPGRAVVEAEELVVEVLRERGYPADDHEERVALVSVDHGRVVGPYRRAHDLRHGAAWDSASVDDRREAFLGFRALFDELVSAEETPAVRALPEAGRGSQLNDPGRRAAIMRRIDRLRGGERAADAR